MEIILYGVDCSPDCSTAKALLGENNIEYTFIDVDLDEEAKNKVEAINNGKWIIPTVIINGKSFTNPDNDKLYFVLGINQGSRVILYGTDWCPS
ncbi:MAG: thioredoxin reductase (NADPH) [Halioglobus sp.]|jgi:thioredoxin reductase (NADPH)